MGLRRTSDPLALPISLDEAKQQIGLTQSEFDADVTMLIAAAAEVAERYTGRALITQTWRLSLDHFLCPIWLPRPPLQTVDSVEYVDDAGDTKTLDSSEYVVAADGQPARIAAPPGVVWPTVRREPEAVRVVYTAGYGDDPSDVPVAIRQAIRLMVSEWFLRREMNVQGSVSEVPMSTRFLLDGHKTGAGPEWYGLL